MAQRANAALGEVNERLDETVRIRTADLSAANEEIQRFAYIVSHDLRAPLVNIMGFTSELEQAAATLAKHLGTIQSAPELRETIGEDIPEALRFIKSSTSKMDRLINAILKLSREGRRVLAPEPIDMAAMLVTLTESMQHQANTKQATIEIGATPGITADRLAIEQVFTNVVDNALKYLRPGCPRPHPGERPSGGSDTRLRDRRQWPRHRPTRLRAGVRTVPPRRRPVGARGGASGWRMFVLWSAGSAVV